MDNARHETRFDDVREAVRQQLESTSFGAVILFAHLFETALPSGTPSLFAWRVDGSRGDTRLLAFLREWYPGAIVGRPDSSFPTPS